MKIKYIILLVIISVQIIYCNEIIDCLKEFNQEKEREKNIYSHDRLDEISQRCNKILNKYSISELEYVYRTNSILLEDYILFVKNMIKEIQSRNKKIEKMMKKIEL